VLHLGDTTLTGGELADRISQYIQAFEALGAGSGATVGLLSLNRPEVLMIIGVDACRIGLGVVSRQVILPVVLWGSWPQPVRGEVLQGFPVAPDALPRRAPRSLNQCCESR
jgi:hypothetical protein